MPFQHNTLCGLIYSFQHLSTSGNESSTLPVPLKNVQLDVKVVNFTAEVKVSQKFVNCEENPIECVYFFPVEEEAAVTDFTAQLEGRTIKTVIKEKEEARDDYKSAIENHQTAVLLEETKPDIFEIRVGQLAPGSVCLVSLTYLMELPVEERKTKLTIPTTVAPRYVPARDDSAESKKIASIQHDFNSPVKMSLNLEVVMTTEILSITSPSHQIQVTDKMKNHGYHVHTVKLETTTAALDRDLIVFVDSEEPCQPKVMIEKNEENSYVAMLTLVPDFKLRDQPIEAVFLVDCSGSMRGQSMILAKEALLVFLHSIPVNSFFNVILFGSRFECVFPSSQSYDDDNLGSAKFSAEAISANMGGTEILTPLRHILQQPVKTGLARQVFILTDGQVSNSRDCIELVSQHSSTNRVFTLGIGSSADRHLVKGLARAGGGTYIFTSQGEEITPKVMSQLRNALQPGITEVSVKWPNSDQFEGQNQLNVEIETKKTLFGFGKPKVNTKLTVKSQIPSKVPPIYDGNRLVVYKLLEQNVAGNQELILRAKTCEGDLEVAVPVTTENSIQGNSLHQMFARKMIQELEEKHQQNMEDVKTVVTELGLKYKLASNFTSFVGVDEKQNLSCVGVMRTRQIANQMPTSRIQRSISSTSDVRALVKKKKQRCCLETSYSFTKQESVPSSSNSLRLTLCQNADGSFPADTTTATILGLDLHKLIETGKPEDPVVWATILCLVYLEENCQAERESWELVAEKAIKWLDCRGVGMGGPLEQRARQLIREG